MMTNTLTNGKAKLSRRDIAYLRSATRAARRRMAQRDYVETTVESIGELLPAVVDRILTRCRRRQLQESGAAL